MRELLLSKKDFMMRLWKLSGLPAFYEGTSSTDIDKNLRSTFPRTTDDFIRYVEECNLKTVLQDFAIVQKEKAIGGLSFIEDGDPMVELGCLWISKPYRRMTYYNWKPSRTRFVTS